VSNNTLLQEHVSIKKSDLAGWSPITSKHLADGMSVLELCSAAIEYSDNTAMDLLLKKLGGVGGVNAFARNLGDNTFRLDRGYPDEATSIPGDLRDTTTPSAMLNSQQQVVLGDTLTIPLRDQLQSWMKNNTLGKARIRAGVPQQWVVADKTGTGSGYGATNDAAIIWPPRCPPLVLVIFYTGNKKEDIEREDVLAAATRIVLDEFAQSDKCFTS
jgi:beta-lactamase class A